MDAIGISAGSRKLQTTAQADIRNSQVIAIGSGVTTTQAFMALNTVVSLRATVACWFSVGGTAGAHVPGSDFLPANVTWMLKIPQGAVLSFIQNATAGYVSVTPMANPGYFPLLLDAVPAAVGAYSLRKLSNAYRGACVNIRRSSDNATQDIGFTGAGDLDLGAFNAFIAAGSGFVAVWYDQSGTGNNATQATAAAQPQLIPALAALNNKPSLQFGNAGAVALGTPAVPAIANVFAAGGWWSFVANFGTTAIATQLMNKAQPSLRFGASGAGIFVFNQQATGQGLWTTTVALAQGGHVFDVAYNSSSLANVPTIAFDGAAQTTTNTQPTGTITSDAANGLVIGNNTANGSGIRGWPGNIAEILIYASQPAPGPVRANQKAYWGTP